MDLEIEVAPDDIQGEQPLQKVGEHTIALEILDETAEITVVVGGE